MAVAPWIVSDELWGRVEPLLPKTQRRFHRPPRGVAIPAVAIWGGPGAAILIGAIAGLYPATRAARLAPADALRTV